MTPDKYIEILETILKEMVTYPEDIQIDRTIDEMGVLLMVKVNPADAGMVIGKQGKTITSIRYIMLAIGMKNKAKINIKLDVPERPMREDRPRVDGYKVKDIVKDTLEEIRVE